MIIDDEDYAFEMKRQRMLDAGDPDGDEYEERKLREREEDERNDRK